MTNRIILKAAKGHIYTNGDIFASTVELPLNAKVDNWYEITEEEAINLQEQLLKDLEANII